MTQANTAMYTAQRLPSNGLAQPPLSPSPRVNQLLASLRPEDFDRLEDALELVPMRLGECLYEPGQQLRYAYFPSTAVVSLNYATASGATVQTAGVGRDGMVGFALFMGGQTTSSSALVHTGGHGWRLDRHRLNQEFARGSSLREVLLRYVQMLITQLGQAAACYRHHSAEQQLSNWLLASHDRLPQGELVMTQELLGSLLGVRRETITQAAYSLQAKGYIRYRRGHIALLDRAGLARSACECYGVVKTELARLAIAPLCAARSN
jgi:CRP-like cAMP-binding protein